LVAVAQITHQHFCIKLFFTYTSSVELDRGKKVKKGREGRKGEKESTIQKKVDWQTNFQEGRGTIKPSYFNKSSQVKKLLPIFLMLQEFISAQFVRECGISEEKSSKYE
jgi:hypothetical protein